MSNATTNEPNVNKLFDLAGKVALVTGATGALGGAMSRGLAEAGASVVISSRDQARAQAAAEKLPVVGNARHFGVAMDYMNPISIEQGMADALQATGRINVLINNGHDPLGNDWKTVTAEQFNRQMANATGYFLLARLVRDHAVQRSGGASIIMLGSMYGVVASYPDAYEGLCNANPVAYQALKGGIVHMTRHLAAYWAADGVRVNCLSPGPFPPPTLEAKLTQRLKTKVPMGRMGQPYELKGAAVFLASDASSYVTGQNLLVDGGWTAW